MNEVGSQQQAPVEWYHIIMSTKELMNISTDKTGAQILDNFYIWEKTETIDEPQPHIPEKKDIGRCYRKEFVLKSRKETKELIKRKYNKKPAKLKEANLRFKNQKADFFVYNEGTGEMEPFKKNDYLMYPGGYIVFDGKDYVSYDDPGNEIGRFSYVENKDD